MKQKYEIAVDEASQALKIREYAELDKDAMSLLCEEAYALDAVKTAMAQGKDALITALRTPNMYPIGSYAEKIAAAVSEMVETGDLTTELVFDDIELVAREREMLEQEEDLEDEEDSEIEDLLDEDVDDEFNEKIGIQKLKSSIRVADDEPAENDDDS